MNLEKDLVDGQDGWEDLSMVADNTVYPEGVLLASGISSINSLAFAGALPTQKNAKPDSRINSNGNFLLNSRPITHTSFHWPSHSVYTWRLLQSTIEPQLVPTD